MGLKESLEAYVHKPYKKNTRTEKSPEIVSAFYAKKIAAEVLLYKEEQCPVAFREIRNIIDYCVRRYNKFAIEGTIKSHYIEIGLKEKGTYEHVIPASRARDFVIAGIFTPEQAMNVPTCLLSKKNDNKLKDAKLGSTTPNAWKFFERYKDLGIVVHTYDGKLIDQATWTLQDHFDYFKIS